MWRTVKLGDVCSINNGGTPKSKVKEYWDGGVQWLTPKDMGKLTSRYVSVTERQISQDGLGNSSAKLIPHGSVILSCRAPIGHVSINEVPMSFNQGCKGLVPSDEILVEYLYYFLVSSRKLLNDLGTGTTFKEISAKTLHQVDVPLPPLAEQQRIVAKLDAAFAEIDRAVEHSKSALHRADLLAAKIIESAMRSVENGQSVKIADVANMQSGFAFKSGDYSDDDTDIPLLRGDNIAPNYIDLSSAKRLPANLAADYSRFELQTEDVILAMDRPYVSTGLRLAKINEVHTPCLLVQRVMRLRAEPKINSDFLHLAMETPRFLEHILGNQTGLGVPHISGKTIGSFEFEMPDLKEQERIVAVTNAAKKQVKKLRLSHEGRIDELIELKSAILAQELQPAQDEAA